MQNFHLYQNIALLRETFQVSYPLCRLTKDSPEVKLLESKLYKSVTISRLGKII